MIRKVEEVTPKSKLDLKSDNLKKENNSNNKKQDNKNDFGSILKKEIKKLSHDEDEER